MGKKSCGIVSVIIGREFSLKPLLNYFNKVEVPDDIDLNLYLVLGCDKKFEDVIKNNIINLGINNKYKNIYYINGETKCYSNLEWEEWEEFTRKKDPDKKHKSALLNINKGLEASQNEDYIHFVDDDTIPPLYSLKALMKTFINNNNCGIASGLYFNKTWVEPTIAVSEEEAKRRLVLSIEGGTWKGASIDELAISNYNDIGFVGNGCMLVSGYDIKEILPLTEYREQGDDEAPPDFIICRRIRRLGKIISINPSVIAKHLDEKGQPVGLPPEYLNNIKNAKNFEKILVLNYNKFLNYKRLSKDYDQIIIILHKEIHKKIKPYISEYPNIQIIERSVIDTCKKYKYYKNYKELIGYIKPYSILEEIHNFINNKDSYIIYTYSPEDNRINHLDFLDSRNLKNFLNKTI